MQVKLRRHIMRQRRGQGSFRPSFACSELYEQGNMQFVHPAYGFGFTRNIFRNTCRCGDVEMGLLRRQCLNKLCTLYTYIPRNGSKPHL